MAVDTSDVQDETVAETRSLQEQVQGWLDALEQTLRDGARADFDVLFDRDSYWRDMVALTWDTCQFWGRDAMRDTLLDRSADQGLKNLHLDPERSAPRVVDFLGEELVEGFFAFETRVGTGKGFVRLAQDSTGAAGLRARHLATGLVALDCVTEPTERHPGLGFDPAYPGQTWGEWVAAKSDFRDRDPDVLIIGGSHSGLSVGARFERKGMSYLIVERNERPGDMWRGRYESLALHTHTRMNDLPYIPLPPHWGSFTPKDQWADWLDCYATLMNLNLWTSTEALSGSFDEESRRWEVRVRRADGTERTLRPKHVVLAVGGVGGTPNIPALPGLDEFTGEVLHSTRFRSGTAYTGKDVLVVGSSTTAHDICLDLAHNGARPTMAQRGATCVVDIDEVVKFSADYAQVSVEEADQMRSSMVLPVMVARARAATARTEVSHAHLHAGLRAAGQKLTIGDDETGWIMKLFRDTKGYYLNVGASEAIVEGKIKVLDYERIERFAPDGARLTDGTVLPLDVVVLATGFHDLSEDVAKLFGPEVAAKIGRCIGVAEDGEYRTMSRPTAQAHLWLINGGIVDARKSSDLLAMQIIAQMQGLVPSLVRQSDGSVRPL